MNKEIEQPLGMKPMTAKERKECGLPPLEESEVKDDLEAESNA